MGKQKTHKAIVGRIESILVLLAYMVCADDQIHNLELEQINNAIDELNADNSAKELVQQVFSQAPNALPLNLVIKSIRKSDRLFVLNMLARVAWADQVFVKKEIDFIQTIACDWRIDSEVIDKILVEAEKDEHSKSKAIRKQQKRVIRSKKKRLKLKLKKALEAIHLKVSSDPSVNEDVQKKITFYEKELLLSGSEFDAVLKQCSRISHEDFSFAKKALSNSMDTMTKFKIDLEEDVIKIKKSVNHKYEKTKKEVIKGIEIIQKELDEEAALYIKGLQLSLQSKLRSLDYFTVAFMGKTKCGKSTLHAFMTGEGWDEIGIGKQRTTRFNRVYHWNNFRIIDTPGIGAPGGKGDEEIALSVIDEADLVCFIVTNDSQQETEFSFLELLKKRSKPLIILLNVKQNLRHEKKLERFLKDPSKLLKQKGSNSLAGHINRIRRYAKQHYSNDYFEIVPVHFLAALMSREDQYSSKSKELFKSSQIDNFLQNLRFSIIENGPLRRSQSILGGTAGSIFLVKNSLSSKLKTNQDKIKLLEETNEKTLKFFKQAGRDAKTTLKVGIVGAFNDAKAIVQDFAEAHWNAKQEVLAKEWKASVCKVGLEMKLDTVIAKVAVDYNNQLNEILVEIDQEMQLLNRFSFVDQEPKEQSRNVVAKGICKYGGGVVGAVGSILVLTGGAGLPFIIAGAILYGLNYLFKSKKKKRQDAVKAISTELVDKLEKQRETIQENALDKLTARLNRIEGSVSAYFEVMINSLSHVSLNMTDTLAELESKESLMNRAYAMRIIDWLENDIRKLTQRNVNNRISVCSRSYGESFSIETKQELLLHRGLEQMQRLLQEDLHLSVSKQSNGKELTK